MLKSPDLAIGAIFDKRADARQVAKLLLEFLPRHTFTIHYLPSTIYSSSTVCSMLAVVRPRATSGMMPLRT